MQCIINILLDYVNAGMCIKFCVVGNYRCVAFVVNLTRSTFNLNSTHVDIAAEQDITVAGDSTGAGFIAYKLNADRVISL